MNDDDDERHVSDDELFYMCSDWLKHRFEIHPAMLRRLIERFVTLKAELTAERLEAEARKRQRGQRDREIATVVYRHLWTDTSLMEAKRRAAGELQISVPAVDQAFRRSGRRHGYGCDIHGNPLDPDHPWNRWKKRGGLQK